MKRNRLLEKGTDRKVNRTIEKYAKTLTSASTHEK